ncbi:hypothetical protein M0R04_00720 [Candidatus Dojkabacteria bacterium]|jgi:hypothetical protein|nr:hypothetical protein [Candidatus Dojkabacteria bacterium]
MFRQIVSPFQQILLKRRLCVGCTQPLDKGKKLGNIKETKELVECKCKRRFILDKETNTFRRATLDEEALFINSRKKI